MRKAMAAAALLLSTLSLAQAPATAIVVDVYEDPICYGLDCPPFPTPKEMGVCFKAADAYYPGTFRAYSRKRDRIKALQGKTVLIIVTEKEIRITDPRIGLRRVRKSSGFKLDSCNDN